MHAVRKGKSMKDRKVEFQKELKEEARDQLDKILEENKTLKEELQRISDTPILSAVPSEIVNTMENLSDDERLEVINSFCKFCGSKDVRCQCWNDE